MTPIVSQEEPQPELQPTEPNPVEPVSAAIEDAPTEAKPNPWKTAFIVLIGIVLLSGIMIYSTSVKQTDPTTVLQTDANGQPVQPLNPASGVEEDRLASMPTDAAIANTNTAQPGQLPGGDGLDPWANGGKPPPGGPPVGPGGSLVTVPNGGSQFMPPDCILQPSGIYLCPVPVNANTAKPSPTPKPTPPNANVQASPAPAAGATPKTSPTPPGAKPTPTPRTQKTPVKPGATKTPEEN